MIKDQGFEARGCLADQPLRGPPAPLLAASDSSPATARTQNESSRQSRDAAMYREGEATQSILIPTIVEAPAFVSLS
jgi:hypothetical protein